MFLFLHLVLYTSLNIICNDIFERAKTKKKDKREVAQMTLPLIYETSTIVLLKLKSI